MDFIQYSVASLILALSYDFGQYHCDYFDDWQCDYKYFLLSLTTITLYFICKSFMTGPKNKYLFMTGEIDEQFYLTLKKYIENTKKELHIVLTTNGGYQDYTEKILEEFINFDGEINIYVTSYALSAGTFISLCADNLFMNDQATLSPFDPQVDGKSIANDEYLMEHYKTIYDKIKKKKLRPDSVHEKIYQTLVLGNEPHNRQFSVSELREIGIEIIQDIPADIYNLNYH